ncbi:MAG: DUF4340 domain-containing protein [Clostridia bacterium]|nr:DUF4340 domain-containing protein [Clostridia bacterium]
MKPIRNIIIIVAVIALLSGGFYWVLNFDPEANKEPEATPTYAPSIVVTKIDRDSIQKVSIHNGSESYYVNKHGSDWLLNDRTDIKLSSSRISTMLYDCATVSAKEIIAEEADDLSVYGLDQTTRSITVECSDGSGYTIRIGNASIDNSICYLMLEGTKTVYAKTVSGCNSLILPMNELLDKTIYSVSSENLHTITIKRPDTENVRLVNKLVSEKDGEKLYEWRMEEPLVKVANDYNINEQMIEKISILSAVDVIPFPDGSTDYGFANPAAVYSVSEHDSDKAYTVTVGKKTEDGKTYLKLAGSQTVYTVESDSLSFLSLSYQQLVDSLVHIENIDDIAEIHIDGLGKSYHLTINGADDTATYAINGKTVEEKKFKKAYQTVIGFSLSSFTKTPTNGAPEFTVKYTRKDGSKVTVECIPYDDRNYVTKVNGEGNLIIRKKQVETMIEQLDKTIAE